jgi:hypothetical protein
MANATTVVTGEARLSYAHIWQPQTTESGEQKYSVAAVIPKKDKATIAKIRAAEKAAIEAGKAKFGPTWKPQPGKGEILKDGDEKEEKDASVYHGNFYVNSRNSKKPFIYDRDKTVIHEVTEVYSGVYAQVSFEVFPFWNKAAGSKGISASLIAIRKLRDGENLGGGVSESEAQDMFDDLDDDDVI